MTAPENQNNPKVIFVKTAKLTEHNDWRFGHSLDDYLIDSEAIHQNIKSRLQCFKSDWWLDVEFGLDWLQLLGSRGTGETLRREISTKGRRVLFASISSILRLPTSPHIAMDYTDVFNRTRNLNQEVSQ
ncbi:hypothetical protein QE193_24465 (plasmid) [Arsenophonus nasoniae]|uniref:hypothetical protein n=1 Tax=Arsenophonus nasoniae TaxID=638 RepID=UPI002468EDCF|nr:hypothetical protein [Arsenophonus nasoniae]WGM18360.1 hypothetical protein QE193_24465 [Arsenophonus nasoniae]